MKRILQRLDGWWWPAALAALSLLAAAAGEPATEALRWERASLAHEPWRIVTGHLLHLDGNHLMLNLAGLAALWALVGDCFRPLTWTLGAVWIALAIGLGLLVSPGLAWYVGLSGVLHGLLAMGAVGLWREWRAGALLVAAFIIGKSVFEATIGPLQDDTIAQAHWWGAGAGTLAGIIALRFRSRRAT